jgi:O-succinylbenzoic acid--CoA ligase
MEGYGFPPDLRRESVADGWWASPDVGRLDEAGRLAILGRLDDFVRTGTGHVVNPADVAAALEAYPGVADAAVVPIETAAGPVLGALVEAAAPLATGELRGHLARSLPPSARPRVVEVVAALPRLPSGRTDRRACIDMLTGALERGEIRGGIR